MIKRFTDLFLVVISLPVWGPILLVIACAVWRKMGRPVLFIQNRPGLNGKVFRMMKFRTMNGSVDVQGRLLPDHLRLTRFGQWLRSSSLDELPELLNILKGDMSLVGPRPLLVQYLDRYTSEQARRHDVRPGITGWAQVHGRNQLSWDEKFAMDVWYVDNQSFWLDLKILWLTVGRVIRRDGISAAGEATMPEFMGKTKG